MESSLLLLEIDLFKFDLESSQTQKNNIRPTVM